MYVRRGLLFLLGTLVSWPALAQTTVTLTGGDPGEGLTLNASNVVYAYNVNGSSSFDVQGVTFAPLALGYQDNSDFIGITDDPFASGQNSTNDAALRSVLQTVAWDGFGAPGMSHTFTDLTPNATYRFDLLYYSGNFGSREQAIVVNGSLIDFVTASKTEAKDTYFSVTADNQGKITLMLEQSGVYDGMGTQDGALLNAVALSAIPEPSTYAAILGTFAFGLVLCRRRNASGRPKSRTSV